MKKEMINTRHILFICSGAFDRLHDQVERRLTDSSIGFGAPNAAERSSDLLRLASTRDFIDYGLEPEFIGRLPIRVVCNELTADDFFLILKTSEGSIIRQYVRAFAAFGIGEAKFTEDAHCGKFAGAIGLGENRRPRVTNRLRSRVARIQICFAWFWSPYADDRCERDQRSEMKRLCEERCIERSACSSRSEQGWNKFANLQLSSLEIQAWTFPSTEETAIPGIVARAREAEQPVSEYCGVLFKKDYPYGLKLLKDRDANLSLVFPVSAVEDPDKFLQ